MTQYIFLPKKFSYMKIILFIHKLRKFYVFSHAQNVYFLQIFQKHFKIIFILHEKPFVAGMELDFFRFSFINKRKSFTKLKSFLSIKGEENLIFIS